MKKLLRVYSERYQKTFGVILGLIIIGFVISTGNTYKNTKLETLIDDRFVSMSKNINDKEFINITHGNISCTGIFKTKCSVQSIFGYNESDDLLFSINDVIISDITDMGSLIHLSHNNLKKGNIKVKVEGIKLTSLFTTYNEIGYFVFKAFNNSTINMEASFDKFDDYLVENLKIKKLNITSSLLSINATSDIVFKPIDEKSFLEFLIVKNLNVSLLSANLNKIFSDEFFNSLSKEEFEFYKNDMFQNKKSVTYHYNSYKHRHNKDYLIDLFDRFSDKYSFQEYENFETNKQFVIDFINGKKRTLSFKFENKTDIDFLSFYSNVFTKHSNFTDSEFLEILSSNFKVEFSN